MLRKTAIKQLTTINGLEIPLSSLPNNHLGIEDNK